MAVMYLGKGMVALLDDEDVDRVQQHHWTPQYYSNSDSYYAIAKIKLPGKTRHSNVGLHRFVMQATDSKIDVDHMNFCTMDCHKSNLRFATHAQSMAHQRPHKDGSTPYRGVRKHGKKFIGACAGKYLGTFTTAELAALAYNEAAYERSGDFAFQNDVVTDLSARRKKRNVIVLTDDFFALSV